MIALNTMLPVNSWARAVASQLQALRPADLAALAAPAAPNALHEIVAARRTFHEALSAQGTDAWNAWSQAMLRLHPGALSKANEAAMLWRAFAFVDLSSSQFATDVNWSGRLFPGGLTASGSEFAGYAQLSAIRVLGDVAMESVSFQRDCWMDQWAIEGSAAFRFASWSGRLEGRASRLAGAFDGRDTTFRKDCWFAGSTVGGPVDLTGARFASDAGFSNCRFARDAVFDAVAFGDVVCMEDCVFAGPLSFRKATFANRLFLNRADFAHEPVIDRAQFAMAPNLTGARFPDAPNLQAASPLRAVGARQ